MDLFHCLFSRVARKSPCLHEARLLFCVERKTYMEFTTFTEKVSEGVQKFLGAQVEVAVRDIRKNNGIYLTGMTIFNKESNLSPTVYLNAFYEDYQNGKPLSGVVSDIAKIYEDTKVGGRINMDFFGDYERVKKQLFCKLVNYEKNKEMLKEAPHRKFEDLAIVCYYAYANEIIGNGTILIYNVHMKKWGINDGQLLLDALENTEKNLGYQWYNMLDMMRDMLKENLQNERGLADIDEDEFSPEMAEDLAEQIIEGLQNESGKGPMYVVTNRGKYLGAICMIFDSILQDMAKIMQSDFIILPSSVHEIILVPEADGGEICHLKEMVREINQTQVEPQEILSDNVYYYDREKHKLTML